MKQILKFTIEEAQNQLVAFFSKDSIFKGNIEVKIEVDAPSLIKIAETFCENTAGLIKLNANLKLLKALTLLKTDGSKYISWATKVFKSYIDSDFKKWGLDKKSDKTKEVKVNVFEMIKDSNFKEMFTDPEKQVMTQHQIIEFCQKHPADLRQNSYATFFLTKVDNEYFVAYVDVRSGGLRVRVRRLGDDGVWRGGYRHRVVSPQLES